MSFYGWDSRASDKEPRGFQVTTEGGVILVAAYPASKQGYVGNPEERNDPTNLDRPTGFRKSGRRVLGDTRHQMIQRSIHPAIQRSVQLRKVAYPCILRPDLLRPNQLRGPIGRNPNPCSLIEGLSPSHGQISV